MRKLELFFFLAGIVTAALGMYQVLRFGNFQRVAAASRQQVVSKPTDAVLGQLEIPRLHVTLPILANDDPASLAVSVGQIPGTSPIGSLGNAGIAGHRDTAFRPLRNIRIGDRIETHTGQNAVYVVKAIRIVEPDDTSMLRESSSPSLTLVTCYPFDYVGSAPKRFVIQAELRAN